MSAGLSKKWLILIFLLNDDFQKKEIHIFHHKDANKHLKSQWSPSQCLFVFQCILVLSSQKEVHIFHKEMKINPKSQCLPSPFCFVLKKSLKVCSWTGYIFLGIIWLTFQTLNSGKASPTRPTSIQCPCLSLLSQNNSKHFSKVWICLRFGAR